VRGKARRSHGKLKSGAKKEMRKTGRFVGSEEKREVAYSPPGPKVQTK